jgi:cation diffusion facilitator CzcD-associated flavoprotein CzcO
LRELATDVLVVGGGLGGVAAALAVLRLGRRVVLTEGTDWLGGQLTSSGPRRYLLMSTLGSRAPVARPAIAVCERTYAPTTGATILCLQRFALMSSSTPVWAPSADSATRT